MELGSPPRNAPEKQAVKFIEHFEPWLICMQLDLGLRWYCVFVLSGQVPLQISAVNDTQIDTQSRKWAAGLFPSH